MKGAVQVLLDLLAKGLLLSTRLLGVELLAEGLYFFDRHHRLASSLGPEFLPCHWGLVQPWMLSLVHWKGWVNQDRCQTYNLGLNLSLGIGLCGGSCGCGCLVVFSLYLLPSLGVFVTSSISINYVKEVFDRPWLLARKHSCEFALEQAGRSCVDNRCFGYILHLAPC